jgi:hypothetical protein
LTRRRRLALALISLWLGAMLFLAFVVPPAVFGSVGRRDAGRIMGRVFPAYYAGSLLLPAAALLALWPEAARSRTARATAAILGGATVLASVNVFAIRPRIDRAMSAMEGPGGIGNAEITAAFSRLHVLSVSVIGILILLALAALAIEVCAPARRPFPPG